MSTRLGPWLLPAVNRLQKWLSKNGAVVKSAQKLRNQCNIIIGFSLTTTPDPRENGEELLARTVTSRVSSFVDVGANQGDWTELILSAAEGRPGGRVAPGVPCRARSRSSGCAGASGTRWGAA